MTKCDFLATLVVALSLGGCAGSSADAPCDPFEPVNRQIFAFNHILDKHAALPAATYYKSAVPGGVRDGMHNFFSNLTMPVTVANDLLQGEVTQAKVAVYRFGINTSVGIIGVEDRAGDMGYPEHSNDFGRTLGVYGIPGGPYLMLPLTGSNQARDMAGSTFVDHFFNPLGYVSYGGKLYVSLAVSIIKTLDNRARAIPLLSTVERNSIDYYAAMRSIYLQKRAAGSHNDTIAPGEEIQ